jgi:hypothetical protein
MICVFTDDCDGCFVFALIDLLILVFLSLVFEKKSPKGVCYVSRSKAVIKGTHAASLCNNARHFKKLVWRECWARV